MDILEERELVKVRDKIAKAADEYADTMVDGAVKDWENYLELRHQRQGLLKAVGALDHEINTAQIRD